MERDTKQMLCLTNSEANRDALYWRYFYKYQSLLARDVNYLEMIRESEPVEGNGVRKESSLPFKLNDQAHDMAGIHCGHEINNSMSQKFSRCKHETLKDHPWIKEIDQESSKKLTVKLTDKTSYHNWLDKLPTDKRAYLDDEVEADYYYIVKDVTSKIVGGFATTKRGYLTGLFALVSGIGKDLFKLRLQQARIDKDRSVRQFRIFCTGEYLKKFYESMGFTMTDVVEWEDQYAPKGWNYEAKGRPNLYNMEKSVLF